jgi:hypothetical protein
MSDAAENKTVAEVVSLDSLLERLATSNLDADRLDRILDVRERILAKQAETDFNSAMAAAQSEIGRVAADATNPQTRSKYATYAALDRVLRPVYTKHGFALSFDEGEAPKEDWIRVLCHVSHRGGHTRTYKKDMPADGKGAKGGDVMTKTHAAGSAMSYGMRYLLKGIFNVAIGEDDDDGNAASAPVVTGKQADTLAKLIKDSGADVNKFLRHYKIQAIGDLPADRYDGAVKALKKKMAEKPE